MDKQQFEISAAELKHVVFGTMAFAGPQAVLGGLSAATAFKPVPGYPHSIARLTAHLNFWQQRFISSARGTAPPLGAEFALGVTDFPEVEPDGWEALRDGYLASFDEFLALASGAQSIPADAFGSRSLLGDIASYSLHNAYHLGQIVVLRQCLGDWTKPEIPAP